MIYFAYSDQNNTGYGNTLIEYNDIHDCMYLTQDGGAIYTYHRNGNGVIIRNNWVHDTMRSGARGIYLDNNSSNFKVYRNVVWNIQEAGIVLNTDSIDNLICNNTVFNCGEGIQVWPKYDESSMRGTRILNNILPTKADTIEGELAPEKLNNVYTDSPELDDGFVPIGGSAVIDGGISVDGITDDVVGSAPDVGAYEYGGSYWVPGTDYSDVPSATSPATEPTTAAPTTAAPTTAAPTTIVNPTIYGDLNGDGKINLLDLIALRKYLAKWNVDVDLAAADCNADGKVNLLDLILMRKYLAKWDVNLGFQR